MHTNCLKGMPVKICQMYNLDPLQTSNQGPWLVTVLEVQASQLEVMKIKPTEVAKHLAQP